MTIDEISRAIRARRFYAVAHALEEAEDDRLEIEDVYAAVLGGEVIEDYPDREPFP